MSLMKMVGLPHGDQLLVNSIASQWTFPIILMIITSVNSWLDLIFTLRQIEIYEVWKTKRHNWPFWTELSVAALHCMGWNGFTISSSIQDLLHQNARKPNCNDVISWELFFGRLLCPLRQTHHPFLDQHIHSCQSSCIHLMAKVLKTNCFASSWLVSFFSPIASSFRQIWCQGEWRSWSQSS